MMYHIEYMNRPIYGNDPEDTLLDVSIDEELNSAGTLTFTIPVENEYAWNNIEVFKSEVRVYEGDDIIWFGRPLQIVRNWNNQKVVTCEGALAYFNDTVQATHTYEKLPLYTHPDYQSGKKGFINTIVDLHNDQVKIGNEDYSRQIFIGVIDVDNETNIYREVDYQTTAEVLQQMCLNTNGGYFILRKEFDSEINDYKTYLDWRKEVPYGTTQSIVFGENLLELNQDLNGSDICTALIAMGNNDKTVAGLTAYADEEHPYVMPSGNELYHTGEYIYHKQGYEKYGRVLKVKDWSDIVAESQEGKRQLFIKAAEWLEDQNTEITTIECSAADLHYCPDPDKYDEGKLRIGQLVTVSSPIHGLPEKRLPIYKISMDLSSGAKKITIGTPPKRELTDIVKSKGGSTRGSSGTTGGGGSGESGGGSGGGTSADIPVKDVLIKEPGDEKFKTAVKKKKASIDISGYVKDIEVDETSVVDRETGKASISIPVKDVYMDGESVVDEDGTAQIEVPVKDVKVDDTSIVDENGIAQLNSNNFGKVDDVRVDGESVVVNKIAEIDGPYINYPDWELVADIDSSDSDYDTYSGWEGWRGYTLNYRPDQHECAAYLILCLGRELVSQAGFYARIESNASPWMSSSDTRLKPIDEVYQYSNDGYRDSGGNSYGVFLAQLYNDVASEANIDKSKYIHILVHTSDRVPEVNDGITTRDVDNYLFRVLVYKITGLKSGICGKIIQHGLTSSYHGNVELPVLYPDIESGCQFKSVSGSEIFLHFAGILSGKNAITWGEYEYGSTIHKPYMKNVRLDSEFSESSFPYENSKQYATAIDRSTKTARFSYWPLSIRLSGTSATAAILCIHFYLGTSEVVANPNDPATEDLLKLKIDNVTYGIRSGTEVEANPSTGTSAGDLTSIKIGSDKYDIPSGGGGGTTVVPNPVGQPSEDLDTVQIGNTIFDIPAGTTVIPNPQTQPTERLSTIQIGNNTYRVAEGSGGETVVDFNYTGSIQTFTAPKAGNYILEVWGAQGGQANADVHGGYGGYSVGIVTLAQGDIIYICVGGKGGGSYTGDTNVVGYNGGGEANYGGDRGNGGGATHIATRTGLLYTLSSHQSDILIVAGGGGGSGYYSGDECDGGSGGGYIGGTGETYDSNSHPGTGGTQSAGGETDNYSGQSHGSFGQGASRDDGDLWGGSGGGGGFYGGGASTNNAGAGGGSGYINTTELTDAAMYGYSVSESAATATKTISVNTHSSDAVSQYAKEENGHARITYNEGDFDPYVTVGDLYDACVANGVTPASQTLTAIIAAILSN